MFTQKDKIIIFGASKQGKRAYDALTEKYDIVAYCDNNQDKWATDFMGCRVISPEEILNYESVQVVIASQYYNAIGKQLNEMGIGFKLFVPKNQLSDIGDISYELLDVTFDNLFVDIQTDINMALNVSRDFSQNYRREETKRKKVLFIAYFFPPIAGSGVQRSVKFVKYLRDYGYEPIVLTVGNMFNPNDVDRDMIKDIPDDIEIIRIDNDFLLVEQLTRQQQQEILNLYYGVVQSPDWIEKYIKVVNEKVGEINHVLIPDNFIYWVNEVLKKIETKVNLSNIDIIFTSGSPYSIYFLGYYIKQKYHIPWVMDDRDAWTVNSYLVKQMWCVNGYMGTYDLEVELNRKMLAKIDWLTVIANQIKYDYIDKFSVDANKISVITNGYDEEDFKDIHQSTNNKKFQICYNGWIYLDRNPVVILKAINDLIDCQSINQWEVEWIFNGVVEPKMKEQLMLLDKYNILKFNGYLKHIDSLKRASGANVLILFGGVGEGSKVMYTGKIFEYLRLQIPILGISSAGGVFDELFKDIQCGKNYEYEDEDGIKDFLLTHYIMWKKRSSKVISKKQEIAKFERSSLTKRLAEVFDKVLDNQKKKEYSQ